MKLTASSYRDVVENLHDGLYIVDRDRTITYWNKAAERISGYSVEEVVGKSCAHNLLAHVDDEGSNLCLGLCPLAATMADGKAREADVYMHHRDGHRLPVSVRTSPLLDSEGAVVGGIELFADRSAAMVNRERIRELEELAFLDGLTRLANRSFLENAVHSAIEEKKRVGVSLGVLFMDIDHFKRFNDTYGHDVGDAVLRSVASTLSANSRPFDLYGRWGGEEFLGLVRNVESEELAMVGERVRSLVGSSYVMLDDAKLHVTISVGATVVRTGDSVESVVKRADTLLYASKNGGRNRLTLG